MGQNRLRVALLGPPRIEVDGAGLHVDTRKAIALLAYLACSERSHGREELAALLWPTADDTHARAALRRTLSALNGALGAVGAAQVSADWTTLELPASLIDLDVHRFRASVASCGTHGHDSTRACPACTGPLVEAVALHRGDFLAGFALRDAPEFDDWQLAQAATLRRELAGALQRLVDAYIVQGRWEPAAATAQRWLSLDNLHEPAHRQLMRLYAWAGQRGAAVRQYRECVRILDQELGVAPLAETTALYQAITEDRAGPPPAQPQPTTVTAATLTATPTSAEPDLTAPDGRPAPAPMVGRTSEWGALLDAWATVHKHGHGRLVAVSGEAGIGKTRLAEAFVAHVVAAGGQALVCRCYEGERLPYGPVADGLRTALAAPRVAATLGKLEPAWLAEAARLLPELAPLVPETAPAPAPDAPGAQVRFLEGLCRTLLAAVSDTPPGVLVVDDAHWADEATLDVIGYLARRLDRAPLLLVVAWRGADVPRGHRLRRLFAEAQQAGTATAMALARLDRFAAAELVRLVAPGRTAVAGELYERSEGLPLLLVAYLAALDAEEPGTLPATAAGIRELFQARIEQVSEAAWQLLTAAAVIGRSFDVDILREASGRRDEEVLAAIEELVQLGLIHEIRATGPAATYDFGHEQMRVLVYEQAGLARRRLLHRRVALTLASPALGSTHGPGRDAAAPAASIARHFQLGGQDAEAAQWFARAGHGAAALYANREAVAHYQAALALGHPDLAALHGSIGDVHVLLGDYGAALLSYEAAAAQADRPTLATLEHKLAALHHRMGDWPAADSHFAAAAALLDRQGGPTAHARLHADWSLTAHRRGQSDRAVALAREALTVAQQAGDTQALAQAHNILGMIARSGGDPTGAREHLERSLALAETLPDPSARIAALNNLALASSTTDDLGHALDLTQTALALCAAQGDRHREAALHSNLADLLQATGRHDDALAHLKRAAAIFAQIGESGGGLQPEIWKLVEW